jgi:hypothetical protein
MTDRTIVVNPIEPALLSARVALGVPFDLHLSFRRQDGLTPVDPNTLMSQLALLPRSARQVWAYDVTTSNSYEGTATVSVPGTVLVDPNGYGIELYQRRAALNPTDPPVAVGLLAKGVLRLEGSAYMQMGPLGMVNIPVVVGPPGPPGLSVTGPAGPIGSPGPSGQRGSIWTTGVGSPGAVGTELTGDMYLDESNGDVWRFDGATWMRGTF